MNKGSQLGTELLTILKTTPDFSSSRLFSKGNILLSVGPADLWLRGVVWQAGTGFTRISGCRDEEGLPKGWTSSGHQHFEVVFLGEGRSVQSLGLARTCSRRCSGKRRKEKWVHTVSLSSLRFLGSSTLNQTLWQVIWSNPKRHLKKLLQGQN